MKRFLSLLASTALVVLATGCADETPVSPVDTPDPSFSTGDAAQGLDWEYTDEHIVVFEEAIPGDFEARLGAAGGSLVRAHPEIAVAIVTGLDDSGAATLEADPDIAAVPRDVSIHALPDLASVAGVEAGPAQTAGHDPTAASFFPTHQWNMRIIDADDAWNAGFDDASGVRVAILDTGLDPFHQDLAGLIDVASSVAFTPSTAAGPVWGDDHFHGTHVGGTVATNGIGTSGVAPHATLIAVKVCDIGGSCPTAAVLSGIVWAALVDSDVANLSLGGFTNIPSPGGGQLNAAYNRAVNFAQSNGVLVVSAAGNNAIDLDHIERDFGVNAFRAFPCEAGAGVCVSATGPTDLLAAYSNFGRSAINVAAPGGDIAINANVVTDVVLAPCSSLGTVAACQGNSNFYLFLQGTSMATPHVSGAAALLDAQSGGGMNPGQLRSSLQRSADDLGKRGADAAFGKGRINVCSLLDC